MTEHSQWLDQPDDALDLDIGRALLADELGSKDIGDAEVRSTARRWFSANLPRFQAAICANLVVKSQLTGAAAKTRNELFAAVLDALLKLGGFGAIPVASLSARLVHYGLERLCRSEDEATNP